MSLAGRITLAVVVLWGMALPPTQAVAQDGDSTLAGGPGPAVEVPVETLADAVTCPSNVTRPVVLLVHGTSLTDEENWSWNYARALPPAGFDVCTVLLPDRSLSDIQVSSEYVVYAIRRIARLAHRKIDVVGVSQGALQPRWALRWWPDIRELVDDYVSMAGDNHGSAFADLACVVDCLPSLWQQRMGARFIAALNAGDETPGSVSYTSVYSLTDEIIQPVLPAPVSALDGASNIAVQDICPGRYVGHVQSIADAVYFAVVLDALRHLGPADPSRVDRNTCLRAFMPGVTEEEGARRTAAIYAIAVVVQAQHGKIAAEPPLRPYVSGAADPVSAPRLSDTESQPMSPRAHPRDGAAPRLAWIGTRGRTVRFRLSEPARVRIAVMRGSRTLRRRTVRCPAGANRVRLEGLRKGRYRVVITATDRAGNRARALRAWAAIR